MIKIADKKNKYTEFVIEPKSFIKFLKILKCKGKSVNGSNVDFIEDIILRLNEDGKMWVVGSSENRVLLCSASMNVEEVINYSQENSEIAIEIDTLIDYIKRFSRRNNINIVYENKIIKLTQKRVKDENKELEFFIDTIDKELLKHDVIYNIKRDIKMLKENDEDTENLEKIIDFIDKNNKHYVKNNKDNHITLFDNTVLTQKFTVNSNELEEITKDGDLENNRIYAFDFSSDNIKILMYDSKEHSIDTGEEGRNRYKRDLITVNNDIKNDFNENYDNCISAATNVSGELDVYVEDIKKPMILIHKNDIHTFAFSVVSYESE